MRAEVSTRFAIEDDIATLAIFEREVACLSFPQDPITDLEYHSEKLRRALRAEPEGMVVMALEEEVVAWLWMTTKISLATRERYGVLRTVYVREDLRGHGLAKSLVQYCARHFEGLGIYRVVAKVYHGNQAALGLLRYGGFAPLHVTLERRGAWRAAAEEDELPATDDEGDGDE